MNVIGLNSTINRHIIASWIKKQTWPFLGYTKHISLTKADIGLERKSGKRSCKQMEEVAIPDFVAMSVKVYFKLKIVRRDNEHHFILIRGNNS
jgi:hypothetical protein